MAIEDPSIPQRVELSKRVERANEVSKVRQAGVTAGSNHHSARQEQAEPEIDGQFNDKQAEPQEEGGYVSIGCPY
jgi:hypothetical protein